MILAAGVGSRLDPITRSTPKPLVPVVNRPVIEHIVRLLARHGFNEIVCNTHYLAEKIEDYFASHNVPGTTLRFNREAELMGTAGGLKRVQESFAFFDEETFLVIGGDDLANIDLTEMLRFHREKGALATIGLAQVEDPSQFGVVVLEDDGKISRFVEKPAPGTAPSNLVNTGVYLFEARILDLIPSGQFYDFGKELFPLLQEQNAPFYGYETKAYWRDIGNLREYRESHEDFFGGDSGMEIGLEECGGSYIGENAQVAASAQIEAPVVIGANAKIGENVKIGARCVIGENAVVEDGVTLENTILWSGARVGTGTHLVRCVVGRDVAVSSNAGIFDATVVSPQRPQTS
jgi:mannose-1-phosphate guanylyltransferase